MEPIDAIPPSAPRRNIKLVIAYDGTRYHGWQRQSDGIETVQGRLEHVAKRILGHPLALNGAGRTDAGVHAAGQVANVRTTNLSIPVGNFRRALDSKTPPDIAVLSAEEVPDEFHASMSAVGKTYRYRIHVGAVKPALNSHLVYHYMRPLDVERMASAGRRVLGEHDFRGFAFAAERRENTVRTITRCHVTAAGDEIHVTVRGTGFLYKMVRNLVGTLLEIGRGRWDESQIDTILTTRQRIYAGPTAPPMGLCLMNVEYLRLRAHIGRRPSAPGPQGKRMTNV
jgi:tRNA pseudouridine38-40 synthase